MMTEKTKKKKKEWKEKKKNIYKEKKFFKDTSLKVSYLLQGMK